MPTPRQSSRRRAQPGDPVRERLVEGASVRFFTHGFRHVTTDDLAEELGISKKTLYARFDTKLQLLDAVIENKFRRARRDMAAILTAGGDFPETLRGLLDCVQRHTSELHPPFLRDMRQEGMEVFQKVERLRREVIREFFGELMRRGRRAGFIRKDIAPEVMIEILLAAVQAVVTPVRMEELNLTPKTAYALVAKLVLEGAIAASARAHFQRLGK
jgi:AcrR family transcriptional regulator